MGVVTRHRALRLLALACALACLLLTRPSDAAPASSPAPAPTRAAAPRPAPLRWGADAEGGAPYIFADPKDPGRRIGFEVDLVDALSRELGEPILFTQYDYKALLAGLDRGDLDFALNGIEITPDRSQKVRFSRPYYVYSLQLATRADDRRFDDLDGCKTLGCVVGTLEETAAERLLDARGVTKKIYDGQVEPYTDLGLSRIDAVLLDLPIAVYYARPDPRLRFAGKPFGVGHYAIAFRKGEDALATRFDGALERLSAKGELRAIYERWGIWNDDQRELGATHVGDVVAEAGRQWRFRDYFPLLVDGAVVTVRITLLSMLLAVLLGVPIALARLYGAWPLRWLATAYVELFRGIPVLLLLYFLYYGLPVVAEHAHLHLAL